MRMYHYRSSKNSIRNRVERASSKRRNCERNKTKRYKLQEINQQSISVEGRSVSKVHAVGGMEILTLSKDQWYEPCTGFGAGIGAGSLTISKN